MKTNLLIVFIILILVGCKKNNVSESSYLKSLTDSLKMNTKNNILIYTINPNDCISCINGFKIINEGLTEFETHKLYVLSVDREIEKKIILKNNPDLNLSPAFNKSVCWSRDLFLKINQSAKYNSSLSLILIYNYSADSILFGKPIREVRDEQEITRMLRK